MANVTSSGYLAAAISVAFSGTQTLVSLADNEWTNLSDEIDNTSNLYLMGDWEFVCTAVAFTGTDSAIELYIVPTQDGTNYPNWTGNNTPDEQENQQYYAGKFVTSGATAAQRIVLRDVRLPPGKYKVGVRNKGNIALAGSGSTLTYRPHTVAA